MSNTELAQLNIATLLAPIDSEQLADFVANLEPINALADSAPGFVWRLQTESGDATSITDFGDEIIVNMSVWQSVEALHNFVYRSMHAEILKRRREWFERMESTYSILWWVSKGHQPTIDEAQAKLEQFRQEGPSDQVFTFKTQPSKPN